MTTFEHWGELMVAQFSHPKYSTICIPILQSMNITIIELTDLRVIMQSKKRQHKFRNRKEGAVCAVHTHSRSWKIRAGHECSSCVVCFV